MKPGPRPSHAPLASAPRDQNRAAGDSSAVLTVVPAQWTAEIFEAFFNQAPFYAGILTDEGVLVKIGTTAVDACGYRREEVLGKLFWHTSWWRGLRETQDRIQAAFAAAQHGQRFQAVLPYVMAHGSSHWVDFALSPIMERGRMKFAIVLGTDITHRINAESELAVVRKRLDSALMAAEIGTYEWDVDSDRVHGDSNLGRLFGLNLEGGQGVPLGSFMSAIHPDDRARVAQRIQHSVATGANFEDDYRVVLDSGIRWINSRGRMIQDSAGRVINFFGLVMDITARKHAEQEREKIADRLRRLTSIHETFLSGTNDFAYVFDLQGNFLFANRPLLKLYGRTLDDVVGKTFTQLGYPAWHAEMHLREIAEVVATKRPVQGEVPFRGESGLSGIFDYIFTPVFGADGRVEAVAGTTRDVTERKRGEVRDRLLVNLDDAMRQLTDPEAIIHAAARLLAEHLGVNRCGYADVEEDENNNSVIADFNRDVPSMVGRYRFDDFGTDCARLMRAGLPFVIEDSESDPRTATKVEAYRQGKIRSAICVPLKKAGRLVAAMAVQQNIARKWLQSDVEAVQLVASRCWESIARARVVRVLAESEQRLRLAVATGRLGVWELDLATRVFTASNQCKANYGRRADEAFSYDDMRAAVHPEDRARVDAAVAVSLETGSDFDLEFRTQYPDGSIHWMLLRGQTRLGTGRKPQRMVAITLDITARKEAEREQIRLREEAVMASRAKDDFLATLSHELRTPLNPVLLLASENARDPALPAEARAAFESIRKNVELEARLIDDLLDLTTIVRGKLAIKETAKDLHGILEDAIAAVRPDFVSKQIAFEADLRADQPVVFVDEVRIAQVFINLLKNAAKFTPAGGRVALSSALEEAGYVTVRLSDSGMGMTPEELRRVFDAFEQGDHAGKPGLHRFGGLGLGLAISRRLVELHHGTIKASSEGRGRGSVFEVRLPLHAGTVGVSTPRPSETRSPVPSRRAGARILLVEDHEETRRALSQVLRRRNYDVTCAASIREARERVVAGKFDLLLSDVGLPDGDGTTLMTELRNKYGLKGVALTGYGMNEDLERCRAAGFVGHLTKPIRVEELESLLATVWPS